MPTYDAFVFDEIRRIGRAWKAANPGDHDIEALFEKIGEMSWRRLVDNKSVEQILLEIDPAAVPPPPVIPPSTIERLHRDGTTFRTPANDLWPWRGFSFFLAYRRYLQGDPALSTDLAWLAANGVNIIRVFGPLDWSETAPDYTYPNCNIGKLRDFFRLCAGYGLYVEFVPGCYKFDQWPVFLQACYDAAKDEPNVFIEAVNEPAVHSVNKPDPRAIDTCNRHGILSAYGFYPVATDDPTAIPVKDYATIHTARDSAWARKARHAQEWQAIVKCPVVSDEPAKAIEPGFNYPGGKTDPDEFVWHHAICALWTPGSTLHTEEGKWGRIPTPNMRQYEILEAVRDQVWLKIGPEWQTGRYMGAHIGESPVDGKDLKIDGQDVWTYSSVHWRYKALAVRVARSHPNAQNGWQEQETWGPGHSIVRLSR